MNTHLQLVREIACEQALTELNPHEQSTTIDKHLSCSLKIVLSSIPLVSIKLYEIVINRVKLSRQTIPFSELNTDELEHNSPLASN